MTDLLEGFGWHRDPEREIRELPSIVRNEMRIRIRVSWDKVISTVAVSLGIFLFLVLLTYVF